MDMESRRNPRSKFEMHGKGKSEEEGGECWGRGATGVVDVDM